MPYGNTSDHKDALQRALDTIFDVYKVHEKDFIRDFHNALKADQIPDVKSTSLPEGLTRQTIRNWRKDRGERSWNYTRAKAVFSFLESSDRYQTQHLNQLGLDAGSDDTARLIYSIGTYLKGKNNIPYSDLYKLQGEKFAMFRESWSKPNSGIYIRSIVSFRKRNDVLIFQETQDYEYTNDKLRIFEEDKGFVFSYGSNLIIFSREESGLGVKFIVCHGFYPKFDSKTGVQIVTGNLMGVFGKGPHHSYRIILRRIKDFEYDSKVVTENLLDEITTDYLKYGNEPMGQK